MGRQLTLEIPLSRGHKAQIDEDDYPLISQFSWHAKPHGKTVYPQTNFRNKDGSWTTKKMHQIILGDCDGLEVDHIDRDGLNNSRSNLRFVSRGVNVENRGMHRNNTSGYKGVSFNKASGKFVAYITRNGKRCHLGYHESIEQAVQARNEAINES